MRFILGSVLIATACAVQLRLVLLFSSMMDEVNGVLPVATGGPADCRWCSRGLFPSDRRSASDEAVPSDKVETGTSTGLA